MNEMACGICSKPVRSDASLAYACSVCGMGVVHGLHEGNRVYCGTRCLNLYKQGTWNAPSFTGRGA